MRSAAVLGVAIILAATVAPDQLPAELADSDEPLALVFFDCEDTGVWQLATQIRGAERGSALLAALPAALVAHPALEDPPQYAPLPGSVVATTAQLAWFEQGESTGFDDFPARLARGVRTPGDYPLWVALELPAEVRQEGLVVGRLVGSGGLVEGTFQADVSALTQGATGQLELQIPATAAPASLELALATVGRPVQASQAAPGVFMIGSQIPLSALPGPGAYRLEIDVHDVISTVERSTSFEFVVEEGSAATSS